MAEETEPIPVEAVPVDFLGFNRKDWMMAGYLAVIAATTAFFTHLTGDMIEEEVNNMRYKPKPRKK